MVEIDQRKPPKRKLKSGYRIYSMPKQLELNW